MIGRTVDTIGPTERHSASAVGVSTASGLVGMAGGMGGMGGMGSVWLTVFPLLLLTVAALLVTAYIAVGRLSADDADRSETETSTRVEDPIERLKWRYTEGDLSEAEFERALEQELEDETTGDRVIGGSDETTDHRAVTAQSERVAERSGERL